MLKVVVIACLISLALGQLVQINNDTLQFVDNEGRTRIFHGVNSV